MLRGSGGEEGPNGVPGARRDRVEARCSVHNQRRPASHRDIAGNGPEVLPIVEVAQSNGQAQAAVDDDVFEPGSDLLGVLRDLFRIESGIGHTLEDVGRARGPEIEELVDGSVRPASPRVVDGDGERAAGAEGGADPDGRRADQAGGELEIVAGHLPLTDHDLSWVPEGIAAEAALAQTALGDRA